MPDLTNETIAAIATPPGQGGVGIIRVSGAATKLIALAILGKLPEPRIAEYLPFKDSNGVVLDHGLALYFPNPHSFTGEDVLEFHAHGGPYILDLILREVIRQHARLARPGEFSERAYLNDKLDLAQAEAICDLIEAGSEQAARSASRSLQGVFSKWVHETVESLTNLRIYVEAAIDFPEEEIDFLADEHIHQEVQRLINDVEHVIKNAEQGQLLREGMRIVLAGQPNTGKSSLLNALAGKESAIVTEIAGTTRDVLREEINLDGLPLHIIDTAGLRESEDIVEQEGVRRAWEEIKSADCVILLLDDQLGFTVQEEKILQKLPDGLDVIEVHNKIDLSGKTPDIISENNKTIICISAKADLGIDLVREHLKQRVGYKTQAEGIFMARRRHLDALIKARDHIQIGYEQLKIRHAGELLAEELRLSQISLGKITGELSSDELLGKIFSSFCIGK
jgi:tRNA modification GTPase